VDEFTRVNYEEKNNTDNVPGVFAVLPVRNEFGDHWVVVYIHEYVFIHQLLFWSSGHALAPLAPERLFRLALSFCGVSCML